MLAAAAAKPESEPADIRLAGRGYLFAGGSMASLASLDERLEAAGRPGVPSGFLTLGAGGQAVAGRLILGAEAAGMFQGSAEGLFGRQSLSAVTGFFDLGYVLRSDEKMSVSILLGIGAGAASLRLNAAPATAFDDILRSSWGRLRLAAYGFLLLPALARPIVVFPRRSRRVRDRSRPHPLGIGLRRSGGRPGRPSHGPEPAPGRRLRAPISDQDDDRDGTMARSHVRGGRSRSGTSSGPT
jgi:hypothetical protein